MTNSTNAYTANLSTWAVNLNLRNKALSKITLANVLAGDTCEPISLADFEAYLAFKEYSAENLQFVVWFQDYRKRFFNLSPSTVEINPGPDGGDFNFHTPSRASMERRAAESHAKRPYPPSGDNVEFPEILPPERALITPVSPAFPYSDSLVTSPTSSHFPNRHDDPLRLECMRIVATFLCPSAPKELTVEATVRDTVIRNLAVNVHPDIFLPVYEETYHMLERTSLPRFLAFATTNLNLPKQLFWYAIGIMDITISLIIALSLIASVRTPPQAHRAWRVFAVPFAWLGSMQFYATWRGFCSQVWGRRSVQLRAWELQEMGEDSEHFVNSVLKSSYTEGSQDSKNCAIPIPMALNDLENNIAMVSPFADNSERHPLKRARDAHNLPRPAVFGPERVINDPRILAVHAQVMSDTLHFGLWYTLFFAALVLAVPSRLH